MSHEDAEVTDVVIVLIDEPGITTLDAVKNCTELGLSLTSVDESNCVIEGTIDATKVGLLKKLTFVKYVRSVFTYIADYPPGDPRNLDNIEDDLPSEADDAGA
jgi:hypothetical protein